MSSSMMDCCFDAVEEEAKRELAEEGERAEDCMGSSACAGPAPEAAAAGGTVRAGQKRGKREARRVKRTRDRGNVEGGALIWALVLKLKA